MLDVEGPCPFRVGQVVYYWPDERTRNHGVNSDGWRDLAPGSYVRIADIEDGEYIVPEGFQSGNGVHWSVFAQGPNGLETFEREQRHLVRLVSIAAVALLIVIGIYLSA
jgi:hypothetical protein